MKKIKLKIIERKNGEYWITANDSEFQLLRTADGINEYLEVFPHDFPFRTIKLKTNVVPMDLLETLIAKELSEFTSHLIQL
jgi:hypothetical protein